MNIKSLFLTLSLIFSTIPVTALDSHLPAKEAVVADLKTLGNAVAPLANAATSVAKVGFKVAKTLGGEVVGVISTEIDKLPADFYGFGILVTCAAAGLTAIYKNEQRLRGELQGEEIQNPMRLPKRILAIGLGSMAFLALKKAGLFAHIGDVIADAQRSL